MKNHTRSISSIVTHHAPHADEYLAEFLARRFGRRYFIFEENLTHGYICSTVVGNMLKDHPNTLFLGVGGGPFDDHGTQHKKSCSELMAEYLGIQNLAVVKILLAVVSISDKEKCSTGNIFSVIRVLKFMHRYSSSNGWSMDDTRNWIMDLFEAITDSEEQLFFQVKDVYLKDPKKKEGNTADEIRNEFFKAKRPWKYLIAPACSRLLGECGEEWLSAAQAAVQYQKLAFDSARYIAPVYIDTIEAPAYGCLKTMIVDGSNGEHAGYEIEFDAVSRSLKVDVVFLRNSQDQNIIVVNPSFGGNLESFVNRLRFAEAKKRGIKIPHYNLSVQGTLKALPQWHVHEMVNEKDLFRRVYNGTTTRPYVEPSALTFEEIRAILFRVLMEPDEETQIIEISSGDKIPICECLVEKFLNPPTLDEVLNQSMA